MSSRLRKSTLVLLTKECTLGCKRTSTTAHVLAHDDVLWAFIAMRLSVMGPLNMYYFCGSDMNFSALIFPTLARTMCMKTALLHTCKILKLQLGNVLPVLDTLQQSSTLSYHESKSHFVSVKSKYKHEVLKKSKNNYFLLRCSGAEV